MEENTYFIGKVIKVGNSLGIIIPHHCAVFESVEEGDFIKLWFKKVKQEVN